MLPILNSLEKFFEKTFVKQHHPIIGKLLFHWHRIVGGDFAKICTPVSISEITDKGKKVKILHIELYEDNKMIFFYQNDIINKVHMFTGDKSFKYIKIKFISK